MPEKSQQLVSENRSAVIHDALFNVYHELEQQFPGASLTIIISPAGCKQNSRIFFGPLDENQSEKPVYYASAIKPAMVAVVAAEATKQNIDPNTEVVSFILNPTITQELYCDLIESNTHPGNPENGYPYVSRIVLPRIEIEQLNPLLQLLHQKKDKTDFAEIDAAIESIRDPKTKTIAQALSFEHKEYVAKATHDEELKQEISKQKDQFYTKEIKGKLDDLGKVSLGELIQSTLGPSSNATLVILKNYLGVLTNSRGENAIQAKIDEILGPDSLFTINNSSKEDRTGLWTTGRLSELLTIFSMIMNNDPKLGLSDEYVHLMQKTMEEEFADPVIELKKRAKSNVLSHARIVGKSGYFPNLDVVSGEFNSMDALMTGNGWDPTQTKSAAYIVDTERVICENGKMLDMALAIGIPHNETENDKLQEQKVQVTNIVMNKIYSLLELILM